MSDGLTLRGGCRLQLLIAQVRAHRIGRLRFLCVLGRAPFGFRCPCGSKNFSEFSAHVRLAMVTLGSDSDSDGPLDLGDRSAGRRPKRQRIISSGSGLAAAGNHPPRGATGHPLSGGLAVAGRLCDQHPRGVPARSDGDSDLDDGPVDLAGDAAVRPSAVRRKVDEQAQCFEWALLSFRALHRRIIGDGLYQKFTRREWRISTHFSGLGTVDVALEMIRSAFQAIVHHPCRVRVVSACEVRPHLRELLVQRSSDACVFTDIFERIQADQQVDPEQYRELVRNALVARSAKCVTHHGTCPSHSAHMNVSGSSCRPWSSSNRGGRRRHNHTDISVFYAWAKLMRVDLPSIIVHENVMGFSGEILEAELGDIYDVVCRLAVTPEHVGFGFTRRPRQYHVLVLRASGLTLKGFPELYEMLVGALASDVTSWPQLVWRAQPGELQADLAAAAQARCREVPAQWADLLSGPQRSALAGFENRWEDRFHRSAKRCPECVFDLGDTPQYKTGLPNTTSLPTARHRASIWWSPHHGRWMTDREKAACMGFPVYDDLAARAKVPLDRLTIQRPAAIGNAMHVANVGVVMLAAMAAADWRAAP